MAERITLAEKVFGKTKTFVLYKSQVKLEDIAPQEDFPCFDVFLRQGETRMMNNLRIRLDSYLADMAFLSISESKKHIGVSTKINIDEASQRGNIIFIDRMGFIVYRGNDFNGRAVISMAMSKCVDVHSQPKPERKHKPKPPRHLQTS